MANEYKFEIKNFCLIIVFKLYLFNCYNENINYNIYI